MSNNEVPLYKVPPSSIVKIQGKKYRVTERRAKKECDGFFEQIYIYPYLPYGQENISNEGFFINSNAFVAIIKTP